MRAQGCRGGLREEATPATWQCRRLREVWTSLSRDMRPPPVSLPARRAALWLFSAPLLPLALLPVWSLLLLVLLLLLLPDPPFLFFNLL